MPPTVLDLPGLVDALPRSERALFHRLFHVTVSTGRLRLPKEMEAWAQATFGPLEAVQGQRLIKITNRVTLETALFNRLRARRPLSGAGTTDPAAEIEGTADDDLCQPLTRTPEDLFGRLQGRYSVTASNVAKYDAHSGLVVFYEHSPLKLGSEQTGDALATAWRWLEAAHRHDPAARYPFIFWNCLWRAGASLLHGHLQMLLTAELPYGRIEAFRRAWAGYRFLWQRDLFADLYHVHEALGLAVPLEGDAKGMVYLTPIKEREVLLYASLPTEGLWRAVGGLVERYMRQLGVQSFNLALIPPPFSEAQAAQPSPEDAAWAGFPVLVRLVDRGDLASRTADFGAMELYAASVLSSDPFETAMTLRAGPS
jgi:hypothetical protein